MKKEPTEESIAKKVKEILDVLENVLESSIITVNFGSFHYFECSCGRKIKRRVGSFSKSSGLICPSCSSIYDLNEEKKYFLKRKVEFKCVSCGVTNYLDSHLLKVGKKVKCECSAEMEVVLAIIEK